MKEKEELKATISRIRSVFDKIKYPMKSFGKDVTNEIIVNYAAEEIVKLVFQLVLTATSTATLGVPILSQVINLLKNIAKESNK